MTKDMWMDEIESITDCFAADKITREEAQDRLKRMGLDTDDANTLLNEAIA